MFLLAPLSLSLSLALSLCLSLSLSLSLASSPHLPDFLSRIMILSFISTSPVLESTVEILTPKSPSEAFQVNTHSGTPLSKDTPEMRTPL